MTEHYPCLAGQLISGSPLNILSNRLSQAGIDCQIRQSSHYMGNAYIRIRYPGADLMLERISEEYLLRGDADNPGDLMQTAQHLSSILTDADLTHRLEVYDAEHRLLAYYHHRWPPDQSA